jgi:hypothetical protein
MMNEYLDGKTKVIFMALCAMFCVTLSMSPANTEDKPNILLIVADDQFSAGDAK